MKTAAAVIIIVVGVLLVGRASARARFPNDEDVALAAEKAQRSAPAARAAMVLKLCRSMLRPITTADDHTLSYAARRLAQLYRDTDDDGVLDAVLAAGFDTEAAETFHGGLMRSLQADPSFLRRHPKAAKFVHDESGVASALLLAEEQCLGKSETRSGLINLEHPPTPPPGPRATGLLLSDTSPRARISIDGKDTGRMTPVDERDAVAVGVGRHRVTFTVDGHDTNVDVDVPVGRNACVYRDLTR